MLLPLNTVQTQMQARGLGVVQTLTSNFEQGWIRGARNLYRALGPTVVMLGARQGLKFGSGAVVKQRLPDWWPVVLSDAVAGGTSACVSTTALYPLDTIKTRWQLGLPSPSLRHMYNGFLPAISYSAVGMSLWVVSRNMLERTLPEPSGALVYSKHFLCGGIAGFFVQIPTFPFDTLKKRLQSSANHQPALDEIRTLLAEGGILRFYRGFWLKCFFVSLNGAIFNTVFVMVRRILKLQEGAPTRGSGRRSNA